MQTPKDETPTVATFPDHEVITPPNKLRKAIATGADPKDDPVARAELALAVLSTEFVAWMGAECERLEAARQELKRDGLTENTHQLIFRAVHDIRGEAATFGYPAAANVADSLCRLLEHTPEMTRIPLELIDQHVDAIRAIAREHSRRYAPEVAGELTKRLREVTDDFLRLENSDRPDYLEMIFAPPLAPSGV
jgi:HPt (histidine-containing phosphotransfer) domain-containing protein